MHHFDPEAKTKNPMDVCRFSHHLKKFKFTASTGKIMETDFGEIVKES